MTKNEILNKLADNKPYIEKKFKDVIYGEKRY